MPTGDYDRHSGQQIGNFGNYMGQQFGQAMQTLQNYPAEQRAIAAEAAADAVRRHLFHPSSITYNQPPMFSGNRYLVVCNGTAHELPQGATLEAASEKAEALAHQHSAEAFVLKPVRKVAPKRDVVTTDLL